MQVGDKIALTNVEAKESNSSGDIISTLGNVVNAGAEKPGDLPIILRRFSVLSDLEKISHAV